MHCKFLKNCIFYNDKMPMDKGIGLIFKKKYCEGNNQQCARYMVLLKLGEAFVPPSLYPNMIDIAEKIIQEGKNN